MMRKTCNKKEACIDNDPLPSKGSSAYLCVYLGILNVCSTNLDFTFLISCLFQHLCLPTVLNTIYCLLWGTIYLLNEC